MEFFSPQSIWIMIIGALVCGSCALLGCFLILKRLALMGDAISHAVLPGIVLAVMAYGSFNAFAVFLGAGAIGVLTPLLIDSLQSSRLVDEDASIGAVFTSLFAIGVILVTNMGNVDLDTECVLYGEIAMAPFDTLVIGEVENVVESPHTHGETHKIVAGSGIDIGPRAFWILAAVFLLDIIVVSLLYKELKICTFDEALAASIGIAPRLIHYTLMGLVSMTTVASFESVGAIIVVAMFIAPAAAAYLLTDRLGWMLIIAVILGVLSSFCGYALAIVVFGGKVSIAGCMATAAGAIFALAFLFSPRYGVVLRWWQRRKLKEPFARSI